MKLLRISLSLNKDGFKWEKEKAKMEEEVLTPLTNWQNSPLNISYSIFFYKEQEEQAKALLNEKVLTTAMQIKEEADKLFAHI